MKKNTKMILFEAILKHNISQLIRKYGDEIVFKVWEETITTGPDRAHSPVCRWKSQMTLMEALECLNDYCDFIEAMIWEREEKGKRGRYIPALFN